MSNKKYIYCLIPGSFLFIHPGHVYLFKKAKEMCNKVIVVLAHDKRIKEKYGIEDKTMQDRKFMISSIKYIDEVVEGKEKETEFLSVFNTFPIEAVIFCKEHNIPKKILQTIEKLKNVKIIELDCYKKNIFSTSKYK